VVKMRGARFWGRGDLSRGREESGKRELGHVSGVDFIQRANGNGFEM
jgi:hypothetical protein